MTLARRRATLDASSARGILRRRARSSNSSVRPTAATERGARDDRKARERRAGRRASATARREGERGREGEGNGARNANGWES
jgi:hypothetical protein